MKHKNILLVCSYLAAIVAANLSIVYFGPQAAIWNALVFIGLDLMARDSLHEAWHGRQLWLKMAALIAAGSLLSYWLNRESGQVALASCTAFLLAGIADALVFSRLYHRGWFIRVNGSNVAGAALDSVAFPLLAFGWPPMIAVMIGQFAAKVIGGYLWSLVIKKLSAQQPPAVGR